MNFFLSFDNGGKISNGGWGGIRTHGELAPTPVFKTGALNRSATHPTEIRGSMGHVPLAPFAISHPLNAILPLPKQWVHPQR
jgi:hypothetical protein